jgi:hypothetical protein
MEAGSEDRDRAAVPVEGGVIHELKVEGDVDGLPDLEVVVSLEDLLPAVRQGAVASKDAEATGGEEVLVDFGDAVQGSGKADGVVGPTPVFAFDAEAERGSAVNVTEDPGFVVPVAPAKAGEDADVLGDLLLEVEAEAVL